VCEVTVWKLRHPRSVAYSVELVLLNKHQISGGGAYLDCYRPISILCVSHVSGWIRVLEFRVFLVTVRWGKCHISLVSIYIFVYVYTHIGLLGIKLKDCVRFYNILLIDLTYATSVF